MAKPQLENGYTKIANEILDHLAQCRLSPNQWQVLMFVIRKTYGFSKKVDYIANFQIVNGTGLCKAVVSRVLRDLTEYRLITKNKKHIGFQKDWELWKLAEQSTLKSLQNCQQKLAEQSTELAELSTKVSSPRVTQKKKETIQKKKESGVEKIKITNKLPPRQDPEVVRRLAKDPLTRFNRDIDQDAELIPLENIEHKFPGRLQDTLGKIKKDIENRQRVRANKSGSSNQ